MLATKGMEGILALSSISCGLPFRCRRHRRAVSNGWQSGKARELEARIKWAFLPHAYAGQDGGHRSISTAPSVCAFFQLDKIGAPSRNVAGGVSTKAASRYDSVVRVAPIP